ncbi:MAG: GAF domain-containing protein [Chloroflexota bacterium]
MITHPNPGATTTVLWQSLESDILTGMVEAFSQYAAENRDKLKSNQMGPEIARSLYTLAHLFLDGEATPFVVATEAADLAKQGLALSTATHMMHAATRQIPLEAQAEATPLFYARLNEFQLIFLEKLAEAREVMHLRAQEESQIAMQQALYQQIEQQRYLRQSVELHSRSLNQILQLNASLTRAASVEELLDDAVSGICQALSLDHVSIYEKPNDNDEWLLRTTTAPIQAQAAPQEAAIAALLDRVQTGEGEFVSQHRVSQKMKGLSIVIPLPVSKTHLGALIAVTTSPEPEDTHELPILLRTFSQGITTMWRNLNLLLETSQRARELEILHGRYVDSVWGSADITLEANFSQRGLEIERKQQTDTPAVPENYTNLPLRIGDRAFGQVNIPGSIVLSDEAQTFVADLIKEMGSALNNAYLLQTTRAYSNQLQVASEVSRAATTILNPDILIQQTVDLIQSRFNFYYVGLFLVNDARTHAVLAAGTGEAGREQLARQHQLPVGGKSMIGTAIAQNEALVEQDVTQAAAFAPNPLLPDTRSELALPLRSHGDVIGAVTVQSIETGAFTPETITVLQNLADQLTTAIVNADLLTQVQSTLAETSRLYENGRFLSEARSRDDVHKILLEFAAQSGLADFVQLITLEQNNPEKLTTANHWGRTTQPDWPMPDISRQLFPFEAPLSQNKIVRLTDIPSFKDEYPHLTQLLASDDIRTISLIPITVENNWLGVLILQAKAEKALSERELQPIHTLADQAAITLANQQLLRQTELLYQIGRSLSQALTRDDALEIAVHEIANYTGASQCRIVLFEDLEGVGKIVAATQPHPANNLIQFSTSGDFVYDYLNLQRQPLLISDSEAEIPTNTLAQYLYPFHAAVSLLIPLASQQDLIGFLAIDARGKRPFTTGNIIFAQTVADHLTTQIENLKLLDEALTRAQELIFLNQIQSNISSILDIKQLSKVTYREVGRLIDTTFFLMAQYDHETHKFSPLLAMKENQAIDIPSQVLSADNPIRRFLETNNTEITDASSPYLQAIPTLANAQSGVWIPFQRENMPAGLLCALSYRPRNYRENDVQLLRSIATQASLAIENASLFEKIQANIEELRELDNMKNQFLANMSHELRTPLNSIIGFSRVILKGIDGPITPAQEEDLTSIYNNGQHLLNLINEILDMAKIEAGKMTLSFDKVNLGEAAKTTLANIRSLIKPDVELISDIADGLPDIEADPIRIRQILINLLSNAAKFTDQGYISLKVNRQDDDHLQISVTDTGLGIDQEDIDKLFRAFEQVDNSTTRTAGGTGLGLPITLWLVKMHHGDLWLDTAAGKGSTFYISLPIVQPEEPANVVFNA